MNIELSPNEARVIGCLLEKEVTTPDQYPLSLNALTNACNQKTNRDPVLELTEAVVQQTVDALMKKYLVSDRSAGYGGRVTKYKHRFCNTEFGSLKFSKQEFGIICVLLLRGPQTPGELRARTNRLCEFADSEQVEATLKSLMAREDGPFIARLPRAAGARESRYAHLFSGVIESVEESAAPEEAAPPGAALSQRVTQLEAWVLELRVQVGELAQALKGAAQPPPRTPTGE
ncbi:MAG: YceH family protein [Steroidobacteraceae bacterium]